MEKSMMNSTSEESGWTWYFEDLLASEKKEKQEEDGDQVSYSVVRGSSMVSDAASYAAWKSPATAAAKVSSKKLSLKKRKGRKCLHDDSLEDTASSPANSPKLGDIDNKDMDISKEKIIENGEYGEVKRDFAETNECTELKKRGLCLVPLSMFVDYLG